MNAPECHRHGHPPDRGCQNKGLLSTLLFAQIAGILLLFPFFGWAIFLLRRRFQFHEENSLALEVMTAATLGLFLWIEIFILRISFGSQMLLYLAALLGLLVSACALYAHVLISLASRILVDMASPRGENAAYQPRFGPVDALERNEDYEGALQEYLVLARIYPRNYEVLSRTARVEAILGHHEEAVTWYLRARKRATRSDEALAVVNQLCLLYDTHLEQPGEADRALVQFMQDYPDSPDREIVVERLERRANRADFTLSAMLEALEENPLAEIDLEVVPAPRTTVELVTLEAAGVADHNETAEEMAVAGRTVAIALDPIEREIPVENPASNGRAGREKRQLDSLPRKSSLQALDDADPIAPLPPSAPESRASKKNSSIGLDAMDS